MCSQKIFFAFVFVLLFLLVFPFSVYAVTVRIITAPAVITQDDFTLTASISGAQSGTNYLRVDIYKDGTANYFGETFTNTNWYGGSDGIQYFPVVIPSSMPVQLKGRIGNPTITQFDATGSYKLRVRRYTASGNPGSGDTMDSVAVAIIFPTPTLTPLPTDTPTHSASSGSSTPTSKPAPTPTPIKVAMPTPTHTTTLSTLSHNVSASFPSVTPELTVVSTSSFGAVLGATSTISPTGENKPTLVAGEEDHRQTSVEVLPLLFIFAGFGLLASCGILIALQTEKGKAVWKKFF